MEPLIEKWNNKTVFDPFIQSANQQTRLSIHPTFNIVLNNTVIELFSIICTRHSGFWLLFSLLCFRLEHFYYIMYLYDKPMFTNFLL